MKVQKYQCHLIEKCVRFWHECTCGLEIVLSRLSFHFSVTFHFECLCVFTFQTIVREEYGDGGFLSTYSLASEILFDAFIQFIPFGNAVGRSVAATCKSNYNF